MHLATRQSITRAKTIFPNCEKKQVSLHIKHHPLRAGSVSLCGYKHAMVQVIAAAISIDQPVVIENPPLVDDTYVYCSIIERAGGRAYIAKGKLHIDPRGMSGTKIPFELSQKIHGSLYLMPSYAMRFGGFQFFGSGGCQIGGKQSRGKRPVGHILSVMEKFGIELMTSESKIAGRLQRASAPTYLDILEYSDNPSIMQGPLVGGATKAAIICGLHQRKVIIANPYLKTDVRDLLRFIEAAGFQVNQNPGLLEIIKTDNTARDAPIHFELTPCISELITYVALAAHTGIELTLKGLNKKRVLLGLAPEFALFDRMGLPYRWEGNKLHIDKIDRLQSIDIDVTPEGIQSDHHPFFALMLLKGTSVSRIREFVWYERFDYVEKLRAMGAQMYQEGNSVVIAPSAISIGNQSFTGMDVRTAAVVLVGALQALGQSTIYDAQHLFRGYSPEFIPNINALGGDITAFSTLEHC